jgi:hypothetical protein
MSVVLVKGSELCNRCALVCHPHVNAVDSLRCFVEFNDVCPSCVEKGATLVVREPFVWEEGIVKKVQSKSPYLRRMRRQAWIDGFKKDLREPYIYLMMVTFLIGAAISVLAYVGLRSLL